MVDERGRPMPNVEVRLADGSATAGRDVIDTTDDAGGFTLRGVRPGRRYTLIAESEEGRHWYFGRLSDVEAPDRTVEIEVKDQTSSRTTRKVGRVSDAANEDNPEPRASRSPRSPVNEDDLPPASSAEDIPPDRRTSTPLNPGNVGWQPVDRATFAAESGVVSRSTAPGSSGALADSFDVETQNPLPLAREKPSSSRSSAKNPSGPEIDPSSGSPETRSETVKPRQAVADEEFTSGSGPLVTEFGPSAGETSAPPEFRPESRPVKTNLANESTNSSAPVLQGTPSSLTDTGSATPEFTSEPSASSNTFESVQPIVPEQPNEIKPELPKVPADFPPPTASGPSLVEEPGNQAGQVKPGSVTHAQNEGATEALALTPETKPLDGPTVDRTHHTDEIPRPTWAELALAIEPDHTAKTVMPTVTSAAKTVMPTETSAPTTGFPRSIRRLGEPLNEPTVAKAKAPSRTSEVARRSTNPAPRAGKDPAIVQASCNFDRRKNRIVDFEIPSIDGEPIKFSEIDADYILLDFWGSWCGPCIKSIPHLVELQGKLDPSQFKVIGISYETGEASERLPATLAAADKLNINYPLLVGEANGKPCPLASALKVTAFPTLILLDRHGRIIWRDSGANPQTLQRLDRVVASSLSLDSAPTRRR